MSIYQDILGKDYGVKENRDHIVAAIEWLKVAQERSGDNGFSGWYNLIGGWSPSYIETTGYLITTLLDASMYLNDKSLTERAIKASDFLCGMQLRNGAFRRQTPKASKNEDYIVFNNGQDILGLVDIFKKTGNDKYLESSLKASDWLVSVQEKNGSWIKHTYGQKPSSYESRVAWALLKVFELTKVNKYKEAAVRNLEWTLGNQKENGWISNNSLPDQKIDAPFTHTISYAMEGLLWSGILLKDEKYINGARLTADVLLKYYRDNHFIPGRFNRDWKSKDKFSCLTGDAQISIVWLKFYQLTKDEKYLNSARHLNYFLKSTQDTETKNRNIKGGIKGSQPIYGDLLKGIGYSRLSFLNWATKFFIDALILEDLLVRNEVSKYKYFIYKQ